MNWTRRARLWHTRCEDFTEWCFARGPLAILVFMVGAVLFPRASVEQAVCGLLMVITLALMFSSLGVTIFFLSWLLYDESVRRHAIASAYRGLILYFLGAAMFVGLGASGVWAFLQYFVSPL